MSGFLGTPNYIGPETIEKDEYHYASDIWSVACFLLHMLTGKVPWTIKHPGLGTYLLAITTRYLDLVSNSVKGVQDKSTWDIVSQNE